MTTFTLEVQPLPELKRREGAVQVTVTLPADDVPKLQAYLDGDTYEKAEALRRANLQECLKSLEVAVRWAMNHDSSGARVFARLLASLYNGNRVQMDVSDMSLLDMENFEHAMNVIRLCMETRREPHSFFKDGNKIFEAMIANWGFEKKRRAH